MKKIITIGLILLTLLAVTVLVQASTQSSNEDKSDIKTSKSEKDKKYPKNKDIKKPKSKSEENKTGNEFKSTLPELIDINEVSIFTIIESSISDDEASFSLIREDGKLIVNVYDETTIIFQDGSSVRDSLEEGQNLAEFLDGKQLAVSYTLTTRSMPPQAFGADVKIVVL
ncbi:MAG: hypothetical protein LBC71_04880 [Oscillospiraceae bacterium]|jgi:hypothetical protein|nr:hypothetical protein [Oscillospiraceae bacterium]